MAFTNGYALLVGVGNYQDANLAAPVTAQDASALATALQDAQAAGYPANQVVLLTNEKASKAGVLGALQQMQTQTTVASTVVIFLAGHGMPSPKNPDNYFFLPYDTGTSEFGGFDTTTMISGQELADALGKIPAQKALIIFNTCFSGILAGSLDPATARTKPPPPALVNTVLSAGQGRVVISACKADQKSWYNDQAGHTLFVQHLLAGLGGADDISNRRGFIGVFDLYDYVYEKVHAGIKQLKPDADQEPVITIHEGVGPFPVALYHGGQATGAGNLAPDEALKPAPTGAVQTVPPIAVQAGHDANVAGRDQLQASSGGVINTGQAGNIQTGAGTQWNIGSVQAGRDSFVGSTVDQSQHGGIRFGGDAQIYGPVAGGDMRIDNYSAFNRTLQAAPLDAQAIADLKAKLDELIKAAGAGIVDGSVPPATAASVITEANAASKDLEGPEPRKSMTDRFDKMTGILQAAGGTIAAAGPIYALVKGIGAVLGLPIP